MAALVAAGCGDDRAASSSAAPEPGSYTDHRATVLVDSTLTLFTLDSCRSDDHAFHMTGRSESGATLEAMGEMDDDGKTVVLASTGIFVTAIEDLRPIGRSAFGEDAWTDRGRTGEPPGAIPAARVNGALIQAGGQIAVVDEDEQPTSDEVESFSLDAYCDPS